MKNNTLVLIDWAAGLVLSPLIILVKLVKKAVGRIYRPRRNGRLIIKFLGAGNYVAMSDVIDGNTTLISAMSNRLAIERFLKPKQVFYIDDTSIFSLAVTACGAINFAIRGSYQEAINLETESKFSKLLVTLVRAEVTLGLTNVHKSYLDALIYDRYFVNPSFLSKSDSVRLLVDFSLQPNLHTLESIRKSQLDFFETVRFSGGLSKIVFAPTGSDTNNLRRLEVSVWIKVAKKINKNFPSASIDIVFPNSKDWQFGSMKQIVDEKRCNLRIGSYKEYVNVLAGANLIVCVDSQSLHIGSNLGVPVVAFFGPTSPYSVNHVNTVYPISKSPMCSPCMHKYFEPPCKNKADCMAFQDADLEVFDRLEALCV